MTQLRHYRKDLLRPGTFVDEQGRLVRYSAEHLAAAARSVNEAIANGVRIPIVAGDAHPLDVHESAELDGRQDVKGFLDLAAVQGGWLKADIAAPDSLPDSDVSVWIEPEVTVNGQRYAPFIRHVLLTNEPAVRGQAPMALLHSPKEGELKSCSIVTSQVGSVEPLEVAMSDSTLLGSIRAKLKLPAEADEAAILAGLDKLATPPAPPALLSSVRTKLGLAADSKDEEVLAKIDHVTEAAKPAEKEPEIPAALLAKQREVDSRLTRADRREFHQAVDALAAGNAMRITPAMAKRLKDAYPTEPATAGALLSAANPMTEPDVQRFILDVLGDLPAHNVVAPGATLRVAPGQLSTGDKIDHAAESAKTLKAAGLAS